MGNNKTLLRFNIANAAFAMGSTSPVSFGSARKIALESDVSSKKIFGDGEVILHVLNDKGMTAVLTLNEVCEEYEVANGRKVKLTSGIADRQQIDCQSHAVYFETKGALADGSTVIVKTWLLGVKSISRPSDNLEQSTDDINEHEIEYNLEVRGVKLKDATGTNNYVDAKGNEVSIYKVTSVPGDDGYDTFGEAVPVPTMKQ